MVILGISASGRQSIRNEAGLLLCGATEELVQYVLKYTGEPYDYISLSGKDIQGCRGCVKCAKDNICVINDDWAIIRDRIIEADALVFGAPNYYGTINALGHAFLERTFSLRHREKFPLAGKLNAIVAIGSGDSSPVEDYIRKIFRSNYMAEPIGVLRSAGLSQCYQCGYGKDCAAGSVVRKHGFLDQIRDYHRPRIPQDVFKEAQIIAHRLGTIVKSTQR
jgi:multimeric flavodoxin WrbA